MLQLEEGGRGKNGTETAMQYKGLHPVLNQVLRAKCPSREEEATEEHVRGAETTRRPVGPPAPGVLGFIFGYHLSQVSSFHSLWLFDLPVYTLIYKS